jgi:hypothetical protein
VTRALLTGVLTLLALVLAGPAAPGTAVKPWTHWICLPGRDDACRLAPTVTVISDTGAKTVQRVTHDSRPIDCFYLYPTVSTQKRGNSTLQVEWDEAGTAITQASMFSQVCRVYAPMYRQVTVYGRGNPYHGNSAWEYDDALAAWRYYLAHYNDGRGVVLIGHSEGSDLFEQLLEHEIEGTAEQKLLVSAILLGGNVVVKDGSTEGGDFSRIPACTSGTETGCVVAYSSFAGTPPADAKFESVADTSTEHVLCVNPAAPGSTAPTPITPLFPNFATEGIAPQPKIVRSIVWNEYPGLYTARCVQQGFRAWLQVTRIHHPGDPRPTVHGIFPASWGLHAADVSIDLPNLVALVASQSRSWAVRH